MFAYRNLYLIGLFGLLFTDRILGSEHTFFAPAILVSIGVLALSAGMSRKKHHSILPTTFIVLAILGYIFWWMGSIAGQQALDVSEDNLGRWQAFFQSLAGILLVISLIPTLALYNMIESGSKHVTPKRLLQQSILWTSTTLFLLAIFPLNYIAHDSNQRWDLGYFKTATPGESTQSILQNLENPITIYLFFQIGMDVTEEIRTYFDQLPTAQIDLRYIDKDLEPQLAKDLNVQNNGIIVLATGDGEDRKVERINIGKNLSSAKRNLKKLDEDVRKSLLKLTQSPATLYFTTGHGELYWKLEEDEDASRNISLLKRGLSSSNFTIKELNIANGLANEIPEDASAVVILAPQTEFSEAELNTLSTYWNNGNKLFIALEPDGATLSPLLSRFNLTFDPTPLTHGTIFKPTSARPLPLHKRNLITNKFSTHASVTTLSRYNKVMSLVFPNAGSFSKINDDKTSIKVTTLIKSLEDTWKDTTPNFEFDATESKDLWPITMAIEQSQNAVESKALLFSDASWLTDDFLVKGFKVGQQTIQPHAITLSDTLAWLTDKTENSGTVNNEQDFKIQGQGWIFFGTSLILPFLLFTFGRMRITRRQKQ